MAGKVATASSTEEKNELSAAAERLCRRFSLADIKFATEDFSEARLIGKGGFGKVYKGLIDKGQETVAIKRLESSSNQGASEFCAEIETLTKLRHINLVSLIGYCNEHEEMILVYEYIARGTLADHLYKLSKNKDSNDGSSLTWKQRLKICIGAGRGLDYLHTGSSIIHRDVKSTNILLDENFIAKVSDFGLAKHLCTSSSQSHVSTIVKGSFGYLDPSYFVTCRLTRKSDTYAFGVVLLEVLCGRPAVDPRLTEDEMSLAIWAREKISRGKVDQIVASNLKEEISADCLKTFVGVAKKCLHIEPKKRPTMAQAVVQLAFALEQQEKEPETYNALRFLPLNAFWSRVKPSGNRATGTTEKDPKQVANNMSSVAVPATQEEALKSEHTVNMLPVASPTISVDDKRAVNVLPIHIPAISLYVFYNITNNFNSNCVIGEGSNGSVFKGVLKNGQAVAIKKLYYGSLPDHELVTQVSIISNLKHENMTQLLSYCVFSGRQILAYELAPNGSLHDILHGRKGVRESEPGPALSWAQRIKIAYGAAKGLEYIHAKGHFHRNIKSSNILIFNGEVAKIADFGLPTEDRNRGEQANGGLPWYEDVFPFKTSAYRSPECSTTGESLTSDVYSFGVILLELLTGREVIDHTRPVGHEQCLFTWATPKLSRDKVKTILDAKLKGHSPPKAVAKLAAVAALCVQSEVKHRPDMNLVATVLRSLLVP